MITGQVGQRPSLGLTQGQVPSLEQQARPLLRMRLVINAASHVVDNGRQTEQAAFLTPKPVQGPGQIEDFLRDLDDPLLVLDRAQRAQDPLLQRLLLEAGDLRPE